MNEKADSLFDVAGKVALITGGTSGFGGMMARGMVERDARVYIVSRNAKECATVAADLSAFGNCRALPGDVSTLEGIEAIAATLEGEEDKLDILVNAAGIHLFAPIDDFDEATWDSSNNVNLKGPFFLIRRLLPLLRKAAAVDAPARIVNIASGHGIRTSRFDSFAYHASKAGLIHMTRHLSSKLAAENITVNAIAPGVFPSRITADFDEDLVQAITRSVPLGRYGNADDAIGALVFLCSRAGAYVSGVALPVDGGWLAAP